MVQHANNNTYNVGTVSGDHMCTHCSSIFSNNHYNTHWLGKRGEWFLHVFLRFSFILLTYSHVMYFWILTCLYFFSLIPFIQAKKAADRVYDSIITESIVSWRMRFFVLYHEKLSTQIGHASYFLYCNNTIYCEGHISLLMIWACSKKEQTKLKGNNTNNMHICDTNIYAWSMLQISWNNPNLASFVILKEFICKWQMTVK